ncbi:S-layer homology domain-containing protein [Cytobacillus sp. IB215316]|uniref:S-layer homology domain-containing protein n=1 Tax=Cytobacillus sp. IB215316 TaxID=3097354 RepID=UPI002A0F5F5A|nr:S-layer homology domain-containing protein [Cytobacillus sp. IB215316]MDX8361147.1 S-layer homology domain-containing protein [Cytobacillus sp. IB215316]
MSYKKFVASTLSAALVTSIAVPSSIHAEISFTDLKEGETFYTEVKTFVEKGIITGYPDGTFKPYQSLSRGQAAKLFTRALQLDIPDNVDELIEEYTDILPGSEFADYIAAMKSADLLKENGENVFNAGAPLTRDVMAMWLVKAFDLQENNDVEVTLTDLHTIESEYVNAVKVLFQNGITTGKNDGSYAPKEAVKRGQFAAFMYRSIYQIQSVERVPDMTFDISEEVILPETVEVTYNDGRNGEVTVDWNDEEFDFSVPGIYELVGAIPGSAKKVYSYVKIEDVPLEIRKITSPNLRQIEIELNHERFNNAVLENEQYYSILDNQDDELNIAQIRTSGNKIFITLDKIQQNNSSALVTIDEIITGEEHAQTVNFLDTTIPEVVDVVAISTKNIKVSFSEAMDFDAIHGEDITNRDIKSAFEIDDDEYSIRSITVIENGNGVNIELYSNIEEGEHTLVLDSTIRDYANFKIKESSIPFHVEYDETKPELEKVTNIYPNQYTLVFNKDIELDDDNDIEERFHHSSRSIDAKNVYQKSAREIVVIFDQEPLIEDQTEIFIDSSAVADLWGNTNPSISEMIYLKDDETPPIIEAVEMISEDDAKSSYVQLLVTFSEPIQTDSALEDENFMLYDDAGDDISIKKIEKDKESYTDQVFVVTLNTRYGDFSKSEYTLKAFDIQDLFGNDLDENMYSFLAGSETPPQDFTANAFVNDDELYFIVDFTEEMMTSGQYSIIDLSKYELSIDDKTVLLEELDDDKYLNVDINPYDAGEKAEIVIRKTGTKAEKYDSFYNDVKEAIEDNDLDDITLAIGRVADKNDNRTPSLLNIIKLSSESNFSISHNDVIALTTEEISLSFSALIYDFDPNDLIVFTDKNNNEELDSNEVLTIKDFDLDSNDNETTITITIANTLDHDATFRGDNIYITSSDDTNTKNRFGQTLDVDNIIVLDKISPEIEKDDDNTDEKVFVHSLKGDDEKAVISLTFSEEIDDNTLSRLSFEVGGGKYEVETTAVDQNIVYLIVNLDGDEVEDLIGEFVEQLAPITDLNNNAISDIEVSIVDEKSEKNLGLIS